MNLNLKYNIHTYQMKIIKSILINYVLFLKVMPLTYFLTYYNDDQKKELYDIINTIEMKK